MRILGVAGILFGACLMGGLGLLNLLHPDAIRDRAGISPDSPFAHTEIRYGGLHVGIAHFLLANATRAASFRAITDLMNHVGSLRS